MQPRRKLTVFLVIGIIILTGSAAVSSKGTAHVSEIQGPAGSYQLLAAPVSITGSSFINRYRSELNSDKMLVWTWVFISDLERGKKEPCLRSIEILGIAFELTIP